MECFENGIISPRDPGGLELRFGNSDRNAGGHRDDRFPTGNRRCAGRGQPAGRESFGQGAEKLRNACQGAGVRDGRAAVEVRVSGSLSPCRRRAPTTSSTSTTGPSTPQLVGYSHNADDPFGMLKEIFTPRRPGAGAQPLPWTAEGAAVHLPAALLEPVQVPGHCASSPSGSGADLEGIHMVEMVKAATGWDTSLWELMKVGERATTMTRCFNLLCGWTPDDDTLPDRVFEPMHRIPCTSNAPISMGRGRRRSLQLPNTGLVKIMAERSDINSPPCDNVIPSPRLISVRTDRTYASPCPRSDASGWIRRPCGRCAGGSVRVSEGQGVRCGVSGVGCQVSGAECQVSGAECQVWLI